jgi:lipoprotein-releasing system permease protein
MNLAWWFAVPSTGLGGTVRKQAAMSLRLMWHSLTRADRIVIGTLLVLFIIWGFLVFSRHLGNGSRRVLSATTGTTLLLVATLSWWAHRLPQSKTGVFILWHQLVRAGAVICGVVCMFGLMGLLLPKVLDYIERRGFVSFVAARHVRANKSGFLTIISVLSISGVALSCMTLCLVTSIMGGFGADLKRKILGNNAHVRIEAAGVRGFDQWQELLANTRQVPGVRGATPIAAGEVMASSASSTAGAIIRGIDPNTIGSVIDLLKNIEVGKIEYMKNPALLTQLSPEEPVGLGPGGEVYLKGPDYRSHFTTHLGEAGAIETTPAEDVYPGIVIGRELAKSLHVFVGDELTIVSPLGDLGPIGILPRSRRYRVAAVFYSGMYEYDNTYAYVMLDVAQKFLDLGDRLTHIDIKVADAEAVHRVRDDVKMVASRNDMRVRDWKELNRNLFSALRLEKITTFIILSIAIAVASFCIICTLLLMVTEKSKEIAILKSIGASNQHVMRLFMAEGLIIGGIGTLFGVVSGWALAKGLQLSGFRLSPDVYYVDRLPIEVNWSDYVTVAISALVITTIATIYPAVAASRLRPVDGIRYE